MKIFSLSIGVLFLFACAKNENVTQVPSLNNAKWVDLTHPFSASTLYWPNNPKGFTRDTLFEGMTDKGYYYSSFDFYAPEHGGTHLDAPVHFAKGKKSVDQLELNQLIGEGVVIDVSKNAATSRDYLINIDDVTSWEKENGQLKENMIVLFKTGYAQFYPDALKYFGTDKKGEEAIPFLHFPGIDPNLAGWLIKNRKIKAVGLDTPSIDYGQSTDFQTHRILLAENIPAFENVANLDQLSGMNIYVVALPMLLKDGSGAPLRIVASVTSANAQ
ncbi:MAG TPA: cyclase family protein [Saprospiraceae bacterium]|nr:cyclase family protein [Saprospiraceae bacterium]